MRKLAIQGGYGSFHEIAALCYFINEEVEIVPCNTFKDVFNKLKNKEVELGIVAIENSIAGSILPNYSLLQNSKSKIVGEVYLRICQNLMALPGQKIEDIKEVRSHPMAIMQCESFFEKYPIISLIDSIDTALSAKEISDKKLIGVGTIASELASEKYGLQILAKSIETDKMNYTRFLILSEDRNDKENNINKASISFSLKHEIGSLSTILSMLSFYNINLTKIQSLPIIGKSWEYQFYVDLTFDDYEIYNKAIGMIIPYTLDFNAMGEYTEGKTIK